MGMIQKTKEGKFNGGKVLGYFNKNKELSIVPEEAEIIKIILGNYVIERTSDLNIQYTWGLFASIR
jgi:site-specific DNA recombinase